MHGSRRPRSIAAGCTGPVPAGVVPERVRATVAERLPHYMVPGRPPGAICAMPSRFDSLGNLARV